jgi:hypothetical protein
MSASVVSSFGNAGGDANLVASDSEQQVRRRTHRDVVFDEQHVRLTHA